MRRPAKLCNILVQSKKDLLSLNKVCLYTQKEPTANSCSNFPRQKAAANPHEKNSRQLVAVNSHVKKPRQIILANTCEAVPTMLLFTHNIIKKSFIFYFQTCVSSLLIHFVLGTWLIRKIEWFQMQDTSSKRQEYIICKTLKLKKIEYLFLITQNVTFS